MAKPRWHSIGDALAGSRGAGQAPTDTAGMVSFLYGTGRGGRPNTRAAAEGLGISQRQVQRLIKTGGSKSPALAALRGQAEAAADTPANRSSAIGDRRRNRMSSHGAKLRFKGRMRVSSSERGRTFEHPLPPEALDEIATAWEAGGEPAARAALSDALSQFYTGQSTAITEISNIEFQRRSSDD